MRAELAGTALFLIAWAGAADAQTAPAAGGTIGASVAEAVQRFGLPEPWIRAVMRRESAGDPRATSPKGAMGLMQLMPDTWAALRVELGLGADPYDVHDNILAGAAYLRRLYDQFGANGFLAAYNAGPRRYLDFLTGGRPLPDETRAYVAALNRSLVGSAAAVAPLRMPVGTLPSPPPSVFAPLDAAFPRSPPASSALFVVTSPR